MEGTGVSGLAVGGGVDEARDPGGVGGTGAHWAGFERGVECATGEAPTSCFCGGPPDGQEFGVGRRVLQILTLVGGDCQDLFSTSDYGADGYFPLFGGLFGCR